MKTRILIIRCDVPDGAKLSDIRDYVTDALGSWCGGLMPPGASGDGNFNPANPGDPMFEGIKVKSIVFQATPK